MNKTRKFKFAIATFSLIVCSLPVYADSGSIMIQGGQLVTPDEPSTSTADPFGLPQEDSSICISDASNNGETSASPVFDPVTGQYTLQMDSNSSCDPEPENSGLLLEGTQPVIQPTDSSTPEGIIFQ